MVSARFAVPALAALLSFALVRPVLADAPAAIEETLLPVADVLDAPLAVLPAPALSAPAAPVLDGLEVALLDRVNADRAAYGLAPLEADLDLLGIARARAAAQVALPALSHYDASGKLAVQGMLAGYSYSLAGENLARLRADDADAAPEAETALMNSPLHRKNILEPRFNRVAIGLVRAPDGRLVFAQIFRSV